MDQEYTVLVSPSIYEEKEEEKPVKKDELNIFDYIHMISHTKRVPEFNAHFEKVYVPYVVNMYFSLYQDTAVLANELQVRCLDMSKRVHFLFLHSIIPRRKREWCKWYKPEKLTDDIQLIMNIYNYNRTNAELAYSLLSKQDIKELKIFTMKGGKGAKK